MQIIHKPQYKINLREANITVAIWPCGALSFKGCTDDSSDDMDNVTCSECKKIPYNAPSDIQGLLIDRNELLKLVQLTADAQIIREAREAAKLCKDHFSNHNKSRHGIGSPVDRVEALQPSHQKLKAMDLESVIKEYGFGVRLMKQSWKNGNWVIFQRKENYEYIGVDQGGEHSAWDNCGAWTPYKGHAQQDLNTIEYWVKKYGTPIRLATPLYQEGEWIEVIADRRSDAFPTFNNKGDARSIRGDDNVWKLWSPTVVAAKKDRWVAVAARSAMPLSSALHVTFKKENMVDPADIRLPWLDPVSDWSPENKS